MDAFCGTGLFSQANAFAPLFDWTYRAPLKPATAIWTNVVQYILDATRAECALVGAYPGLRRCGRKVLVAALTIGA